MKHDSQGPVPIVIWGRGSARPYSTSSWRMQNLSLVSLVEATVWVVLLSLTFDDPYCL